jgi:hypothetical protein
LEPLKWWLYERHYRSIEVYQILASVADRRSLDEMVAREILDREDEALAYEQLERCIPTVDYDDPAWFAGPADFETWEDGPAIPERAVLRHPSVRVPSTPIVAEPAVDWSEFRRQLHAGSLPPIMGGSPGGYDGPHDADTGERLTGEDLADKWLAEDEAAKTRYWPI